MDNLQHTSAGCEAPAAAEPASDLRVGELAHWAEAQLGWLARKTRAERSSDLFLYVQAAKLVEEVGELHSELLSRGKRQRQGKTNDAAGIEGELADVVICVTIIAQTLGIDLAGALIDKMRIVDDRVVETAGSTG